MSLAGAARARPTRAPRTLRRSGARVVGRTVLAGALLAGLLAFPGEARAQDPPQPPPPPADTLPPPVVDTAAAPPAVDTTVTGAAPDTAGGVFHNLPRLADGPPPGWERGIWEWDHEAIMASGANTLLELVAPLPGIVPLRAGDYGTPAALGAFGLGAGGLRIVRDGWEVTPLSGGVPDLQLVGLGGIEHVRLRREGGGILLELRSRTYDDGRPYSLVEAGTGDLDNNLFRGTFADPGALGGSLGVALEREDSRGAGQGEAGSRIGSWVRYQLHRGDDAGLAVDFRRMSARTEVEAYASPRTRTDLVLRGRARLADGLVAEAYTGRASLDVGDERPAHATEGGTVTQHGARLSLERGGAWVLGEMRLFGGDGLAEHRAGLSGGWGARIGGVSARVVHEDWKGARPSHYGVEGWLGPLGGITLFGSWHDGRHGAPSGPLQAVTPATPPDDPAAPEPPPVLPTTLLVADRTAWRAGASLSWGGLFLSGAALGVRDRTILPLGLAPDRGAVPVPGVQRRGWEVTGRVPTGLEGLQLTGSYQEWDRPGPYLPGRIYRGAIDYHALPMESDNLEIRVSVGVRGHDPMLVFVQPGAEGGVVGEGGPLAVVPFFQSWDAHAQIRVVTVRLFVSWENLAVRRNLQAWPGRLLPPIRTSYGIRWNMWN